jgi:hypothetical protein
MTRESCRECDTFLDFVLPGYACPTCGSTARVGVIDLPAATAYSGGGAIGWTWTETIHHPFWFGGALFLAALPVFTATFLVQWGDVAVGIVQAAAGAFVGARASFRVERHGG